MPAGFGRRSSPGYAGSLHPPVQAGESVLIRACFAAPDGVPATGSVRVVLLRHDSAVLDTSVTGFMDAQVVIHDCVAADSVAAEEDAGGTALEALVVLALPAGCPGTQVRRAEALLRAVRPGYGFIRATRRDVAELNLDILVRRRFLHSMVSHPAYGSTKDCLAMAPGDTVVFELPQGVTGRRMGMWTSSSGWDRPEQPVLTVEALVDGWWEPVLAWQPERAVHLEWLDQQAGLAPGTRRIRCTVQGGDSPILIGEPFVRGSQAGSQPPNLLLVDLDTMRRDRLGCYGYRERPTSDRLDSLLKEWGFSVFRHAHAASPWTVPSTAKFFTSRYLDIDTPNEVPRRYTMLAETLRHCGFFCAAFTGGVYLRLRGFEQGFHEYQWSSTVGKVEHVMPATRAMLRNDPPEPFFLFVHTYETHEPLTRGVFCRDLPRGRLGDLPAGEPLTPPEWDQWKCMQLTGEESLYVEAAYDGTVRTACDATEDLLRLLEDRGLRERTAVVILSDHGEEFWDHFPGFCMHGQSLYGEVLDVPLMVYDPRYQRSGWRTIDQDVSLVDLVPTVADMLGIALEQEVDGVSLVPAMGGIAVHRRLPILAIQRDAYLDVRVRGCVIAGRHKLIQPLTALPVPYSSRYECFNYGLSRELYDLSQDSVERSSLAVEHAARAESLTELLSVGLAQSLQPGPGDSDARPWISESLREQLEAAGYILP